MTSMNRIGFIGNTNQLNIELVTMRALAAQDAAIKKKKKRQNKNSSFICVYFLKLRSVRCFYKSVSMTLLK